MNQIYHSFTLTTAPFWYNHAFFTWTVFFDGMGQDPTKIQYSIKLINRLQLMFLSQNPIKTFESLTFKGYTLNWLPFIIKTEDSNVYRH